MSRAKSKCETSTFWWPTLKSLKKPNSVCSVGLWLPLKIRREKEDHLTCFSWTSKITFGRPTKDWKLVCYTFFYTSNQFSLNLPSYQNLFSLKGMKQWRPNMIIVFFHVSFAYQLGFTSFLFGTNAFVCAQVSIQNFALNAQKCFDNKKIINITNFLSLLTNMFIVITIQINKFKMIL